MNATRDFAGIEITAGLVRELVRTQHPDLAALPVRLAAHGWDNQMWRLGDDLAIRLPWATSAADALLRKEYRWVPQLARRLPLPVPVPLRLGEPSELFARPWLITTWVPGTPADRAPATCPDQAARALAGFLSAMHQPAPAQAPAGRGRGGALGAATASFLEQLESAADHGLVADPGAVRAIWDDAAAAPEWDGPPMWLHGDLHPANVLTRDGAVCGVIDFGDVCAGDPAYDLAAAWILLPDGGLDLFARAYRPGIDAATWRRARGCAAGRALAGILVGDAGVHGRPGGKSTWGPPAQAALRRLLQTA